MGYSFFGDTFTNFLSGLGVVGRDKLTAHRYTKQIWARDQLEASYQSDWIARKAITIPALDATREWRAWQAEQDQIELLEETEDRLRVRLKLQEALIKARLYGGCCLLIGVEGNMASELDPETIGKDGLKFLHVLAPHQLNVQELVKDISDPYYGQPEFYELHDEAGKFGTVRIHPSRMIRLLGLDPPDPMVNYGWGDPVLQMINDAVASAGTVAQSIAAMISEAKFDVVKIPGLTEIFSTTEGTTRLVKRFSEANVAKSVINAVVLDGEEEWQRIGVDFSGMPEVLQMYLQIAAGAADIPVTRFVGQSPAGLNATGDSDIRNYYDRIKSDQELRLQPALEKLDIAIQRSALGKFDPDVFYEWNPLWQMSEAEKAIVAKSKAETANLDAAAGLVPFDALVRGRCNQLIEDGTYPGLEAGIEEAIEEQERLNEEELAAEQEQQQLPPPGKPGQKQLPPPQRGMEGQTKAEVAKDSTDPFGRISGTDALRMWREEMHQRNEEGEFGSSAANRAAKSARAVAALSSGRAKKGGEVAEANKYFYKGGQFLPITEAPPGTWRIKVNGKASNLPNGSDMIEPGKREARPTPFSVSVHQVMGAGSYVNIDEGKASVNPNVNWDYLGTTPDEKRNLNFKRLATSVDQYSTNDLVDLYNKGVRWIDLEPNKGVEIVAKAPLPSAGEPTFGEKLESFNIGMGNENFDRYKLINLHKKEIGPVKRGTRIEEVVNAIYAKRQGAPLPSGEAEWSKADTARHQELEERYSKLTPEELAEYARLSERYDAHFTKQLNERSAEEAKEVEIQRRMLLIKKAAEVTKELDFPFTRVEWLEGAPEFEVNGVKMKAAGTAAISEGDKGKIRMYFDQLNETSVVGVMVHEIEHFKFQHALDAYQAETDAMMKDPGPAPDPNAESYPQRRGGSHAVMNAMGELRPPYDKKYPIYTAMHEAYSKDVMAFALGDGVSAYSAAYWKEWHSKTGNVATSIAVHETLAEMARIKYVTGKFPEHYGFSPVIRERNEAKPLPEGEIVVPKGEGAKAGTALWRNLYRTVDKLWKERAK